MTEAVRSREHTNNLESLLPLRIVRAFFSIKLGLWVGATPMLVHVPGSISESVPVLSSLQISFN